MQTGSLIIKKITAFLLWLNYYFEYSLIFKGFSAIKKAAQGSKILKSFLSKDFKDYWQGSLIFRFIQFFSTLIIKFFHLIFKALAKLNKNSINKKIFDFCFKPINKNGFVYKAVVGSIPARFIYYFFGEKTDVFSLKSFYMLFLTITFMVPSHLWNNMYLLLSAGFFVVLFAIKWFHENDINVKPKFNHISPALILFVFFCALSIFTGYGGMDSLRVFIIFFACVIHSVLIFLFFKTKHDIEVFIKLLAIGLTFAALFGIYQFAMGIEIRSDFVDLNVNPGLSRLVATLGNPNTDAQVWAMLLPLILAVTITAKQDTNRLILAGFIGIIVMAFALTFSRSGYVAFIAGVGVFILMSAPRLIPIALIVLVFALPFIPSAILDRLFTLGQDTSSQYRFLIWQGVFRMIEDFWVQGIGMGPAAFVRIYRGYAHPLAERAMHSHNMFLDLVVHSGIGALITFIVYLFRLFKHGVASHMNSKNKEYKILMSAALAGLFVFIVLGVGEYVWFYPRVMLVFWIIAGLTLALVNIPERSPYLDEVVKL